MKIEIALLISMASLIFGMLTGILNLKRNKTADDKTEATQLTTVIVKLETIGNGISEIKSEMKNVKTETKDNRERLIKLESSYEQLHKRVDMFDEFFRGNPLFKRSDRDLVDKA